mmetsp:Transcript_26471/g.78617  ORF Transcript_26471/g.78617 Transcript_26471/m.78617 type:complete len:230 (-) Transcript_26471:10-699(-)
MRLREQQPSRWSVAEAAHHVAGHVKYERQLPRLELAVQQRKVDAQLRDALPFRGWVVRGAMLRAKFVHAAWLDATAVAFAICGGVCCAHGRCRRRLVRVHRPALHNAEAEWLEHLVKLRCRRGTRAGDDRARCDSAWSRRELARLLVQPRHERAGVCAAGRRHRKRLHVIDRKFRRYLQRGEVGGARHLCSVCNDQQPRCACLRQQRNLNALEVNLIVQLHERVGADMP